MAAARQRKSTRRGRAQAKAKRPSTVPAKPASPPTAEPASAGSVPAASPRPRSAWQLFITTWQLLLRHWEFWVGFLVIYAVANALLVHNLVQDIGTLRQQLQTAFTTNTATAGLGTFVLLLTSNVTVGGATAVYQFVLLIIGSLAAIWSLRQFMADRPPQALRIRDGFYYGMTPLIPFLFILFLLVAELLPIIAASTLYGFMVGGGIAEGWFEIGIFLLILLAGAVLSLWLITRNLFALYIVTLPDMAPVMALRESVRLAQGRKLAMIRRLLFLAVVLLLVSMVVLVPAIIIVPGIAQYLYFFLGILALPFIHAYLYGMYRDALA